MLLFKTLHGGISNFTYLSKSSHSSKNKRRIFFTWLRLSLFFVFIARPFKLKKANLMGFKMNAFSYGAIRFLFEEIFLRNEYLFTTTNKKPIIFDCGANIGMATLFLKWVHPESEIYSFEPDKNTFQILKKNVEQNNLKGVHLFNHAVSVKDGTIDFFTNPDSPGSLSMSTIQERMPKQKVTVDCISLSAFIENKNIKQIDFLKMDIEGAEKEVVNDLNKHDHLQKIVKSSMEYHHKINTQKSDFSEFLKIFEDNGFEYQMDTKCAPINAEHKFQDVVIYFYR